MDYQLITADITNWLYLASRYGYRQNYYHAMLLDPPYHLTSITKRFSKGTPAKYGTNGVYRRASAGFMGQTWDGGDLAFNPELWAALKDMLLPGAFCFAFAGSRGWHRMAVAIEDAGFIMHPTIFGWAYGQGFPKAARVKSSSANDNLQFCQCDGSQQQFPEHDFQNNDECETRIAEDFLSDYPEYSHLYDEQFLEPKENVPNIQPSQVDAEEHSHSYETLNNTSQDNEPSYNPSQAQHIGHLASKGYLRPEKPDLNKPSCISSSKQPSHRIDSDSELPIDHKHHKISLSSASDSTPSNDFSTGFPPCQTCGKPKNIWSGHRYGLQALKPAIEPILCFQKPYEGRPLDSITITGAGALNIDGGRIGTGEDVPLFVNGVNRQRRRSSYDTGGSNRTGEMSTQGRWPSNLVLSHSPNCVRIGMKRVKGITGGNSTNIGGFVTAYADETKRGVKSGYADPDGHETVEDWRCVDNCPVKKLGEKSGESPSSYRKNKEKRSGHSIFFGNRGVEGQGGYTDSGGAARFFFQPHFAYEIAEQIAAAEPVRYVAKAGNKERNAGLNELPNQIRHRVNAGGLENEPRWSPIETKNIHPTVKPIALTKYLASLLLPPDSYAPRRILVPFAGSGSEMIGALLAGWDEITGIEMTQKYIPIANARLAWWMHYLKWGQADIDTILNTVNQDDDQQLSFLEGLE